MRKLAPTILCLGLLAACSGGSDTPATSEAPAASSTDPGLKPEPVPGSTDPDQTSGSVPNSLAGPTITKVEDLSKDCLDAVKPIRELEEKYVSGREIRDNVDNVKFTEARDQAEKVCTKDEYQVFSTQEMLPWLNGPTQEELDAANGGKTTKDTTAPDTTGAP